LRPKRVTIVKPSSWRSIRSSTAHEVWHRDAQQTGGNRIAKDNCGGFKAMFEAHGWPERGPKMMTAAPKRIVAQWGSIRQFEA
jgi:hypothetical protein